MEFLLLLLLPLLGSVLGDSAADDDPEESAAHDSAQGRHTARHDADDSAEQSAQSEDDIAASAKSALAKDVQALPGGEEDDPAPQTGQVVAPVTVVDFDGSVETLTLQIDQDLLDEATLADLTAETDPESGNITLALAGHDIAVLTAARSFDLSNVRLEAA